MSSESPEQLSNAEKRARLAGAAARARASAPEPSRAAANFGDETAGETPAQRRKRLAIGIAGGLLVVVAVVVVIMVVASGR